MYYFDAAQPALLYLVPYTIVGVMATAYNKKELTDIFEYSEEDVQEKAEKKNDWSGDPNAFLMWLILLFVATIWFVECSICSVNI